MSQGCRGRAANVWMLLLEAFASFWNFKGEIMTQEHVMLSDVWLWCWGKSTVLGLRFAIN